MQHWLHNPDEPSIGAVHSRWRLLPVFCLFVVLLAGYPQPAAAAPNTRCTGDVLAADRSFKPGARPEILTDGTGRELVLANIYIPESVNGAANHIVTRFTALKGLEFVTASSRTDRYGRLMVHVFVGEGENKKWLQRDLVSNGLALVKPDKFNMDCTGLLFEAEKQARRENKGIWNAKEPAIMRSNEPDWLGKTNAFRLVEGIVLSVGETGSRIYLNFGTNWQSDFTVTVAKTRAKRFIGGIKYLKALADKKIRVRGWLVADRGPMIEVYYPGQIELDVD